MPHEMMYTHSRNYYNFYAGAGQFYSPKYGHHGGGSGALNKTTVVWQSGCNHMGPLPGTMYPFAGLHYKIAAHKYGLRPAKAGHGHCRSPPCQAGLVPNASVPQETVTRRWCTVAKSTVVKFTVVKFTRLLPVVVLRVVAQRSCRKQHESLIKQSGGSHQQGQELYEEVSIYIVSAGNRCFVACLEIRCSHKIVDADRL